MNTEAEAVEFGLMTMTFFGPFFLLIALVLFVGLGIRWAKNAARHV